MPLPLAARLHPQPAPDPARGRLDAVVRDTTLRSPFVVFLDGWSVEHTEPAAIMLVAHGRAGAVAMDA